MALVYYFVKGDGDPDLQDDLQDAITAESLTVREIADAYDYFNPRTAYIRAVGIAAAPSVVAMDDADDEKMNETNTAESFATFISDTQALYDAKYP